MNNLELHLAKILSNHSDGLTGSDLKDALIVSGLQISLTNFYQCLDKMLYEGWLSYHISECVIRDLTIKDTIYHLTESGVYAYLSSDLY